MADYTVSVNLVVNGAGEGVQSIQDLNNALKGVGEESEKQKNQAPAQIGAWEQLKTTWSDLTNVYGQFKQVMQAAAEVYEFEQLGENVHAVHAAFDELAGDPQQAAADLQVLRDATLGVIDDFTLMRASTRMEGMGISSSTEMTAELTHMAAALGAIADPSKSASENIDNFTLLMANQSVRRLDSFNLSVDTVKTRIDELKDAGYSAQEAFGMAVLEEGRRQLELLGDAADVGATNVDRFAARWENMKNQLAEGFAEFANNAADNIESTYSIDDSVSAYAEVVIPMWINELNNRFNDLTGNTPDLLLGNYVSSAGTGDSLNQTADAMIAANPALYEASANAATLAANIAAAKEEGTYLTDTINSWHAGTMQVASDMDMARHALEGMETSVVPISQITGLMAQGADEITAAAAAFDTALGQYDYSTFATTNQYGTARGNIGGVSLFTADEAAQAQTMADYYSRALDDAEAMYQQGLISDATLSNVQTAADTTRQLADDAQRGADAYANMTLTQALGTTSGGMGGEVMGDVESYMRANGFSQQQIDQYHQSTGLATGVETQASMTYENIIIPMLADIQSRYGSGAAATATMNVQTGMQTGAYLGMSDQEIANSMQGMTGYGTQTASAMGFQGLGTNTQGEVLTGATEGFDVEEYMTGLGEADTSMSNIAGASAEYKGNMSAVSRSVHDISDGLAHSVTQFNSLNGRRVRMQADIELNFSNRGMFEDFIRQVVTNMGSSSGSGAHTPGAAGFGT